MNISGIISEYNPFHGGHKHHIDETRARLGADCGVICAMSGNFVQRGEPASFSKNARAEAAVRCGADLVLELPLPWALSSAEGFARGGVGLLGATGVVTHLSFGSETGDTKPLEAAAELLLRPEMDAIIRERLSAGISYPKARHEAAEALAGESIPILKSPNDLLGIEYIKAIYYLRLGMEPVAIKRIGAGHDALGEDALPSASELRRRMSAGRDISGDMPSESAKVLEREMKAGRGPVMGEALETAILSRLRMLPQSAYDALPDAAEGLGGRLCRAAKVETGLDAVIAAAATKRYTLSRLRRMTVCAALGIEAGDSEGIPPYIRVLAANERGCAILREMRQRASVPVITKAGEINSLSAGARRIFALEAAASDLFALGFSAREERRGDRDWRISPVILKST